MCRDRRQQDPWTSGSFPKRISGADQTGTGVNKLVDLPITYSVTRIQRPLQRGGKRCRSRRIKYHLDTRADLPGTKEIRLDGRHKASLATCSQEVLIRYAQGSDLVAAEAKRRLLTEYEHFINGIIKEVHPYRKYDSETWRVKRENRSEVRANYLGKSLV